MKSISTALSNHLDQEVTTLASCWRIVRQDGREFFFTDHDRDIVFETNTYEAESSYDRTAIKSGADFSVDNLEVAGVLDSEKITDQELRAGLFNRANVYIFVVNWADPSQGALKVRRGWFGEVTLLGNGQFQTEIRGLAQALSHNFIEVFTAECRADFCDARCKLNITDYEIDTSVDVDSLTRDKIVLPVGFVVPAQGLDYGTVRFIDGENAGRTIEIIAYNAGTRTITLFEGASYPITAATLLKVAPGCDRSLARCKFYNNVVNRRAEDYVPGNDELMQYPDAQ